ncbi:Uncharacterized conserved protein YbjT, contains NAD(P)-binding and DUF2867 domains [Natronoarchaeum philippinense]|uniref:Uncharacterized conserved protein YbjT, contains NAD(P)-binding and DUF2867 domains n=1 Tax=Natronoarchaeum philippinense TaxID=558529 RepID=A0A285NVN9_NATPI|nr:NmrA family NAD(P)-binding protein [Natronoarchaeum philippinense]SNZ11946.1 Uncharacterized conserved protein YbjT, contains NAD(P)-binding and DUF2867 domains [Natronoarchaeum philippinense]
MSDHTTRTVLVTAATGTVGRHVVAELRDAECEVRAATRDPDTDRERFEAADAVVEFDFDRPETWGAALADIDAVFLVRPPVVDTADVCAFVDATARVGVERIAYLSTLGADRNRLLPHYRIERRIEAAGVGYTFLRASFFAQNLHEVHRPDVIEHDELFVPAGAGATSFVDARDVAAVAARVLVESGHLHVAYDLTGPAALRYDEVATIFSDVLGRSIQYADPSIPAFVHRMRSRGHPLGYVLLMVGIYTTARLGLADRVTDDVERVLKRPPRSIRSYVEDYAGEFRTAAQDGTASDR